MMLSRIKRHSTRIVVYGLAWVAVVGMALVSCRSTELPTSTPVPTATEEPLPTSTKPPTSTPEPAATPTTEPTSTPAPTATAEPSPTATEPPTPTPEATSTPTLEVSGAERYVHASLVTGDVGTNEYPASPPGQSDLLEREYPGAPALIPHSIAGLDITQDRNNCLLCHEEGLSFGTDHTATKIPDSHWIDVYTGARSETVPGARYNCLLCHVPQSADPPLK